jgi:predicted Zn-dependent peptidase
MLGTIEAIASCHQRDTRRFWEQDLAAAGAALIVAGDTSHEAVIAAARETFAPWRAAHPVGSHVVSDPDAPPLAAVLLVDRPGAAQSELRIGHHGPPRRTPVYHELVTMNAILGGQFTSRLNHTLREARGVTYGVRTAFEFRRAAGSFACETSVATAATAESVAEVLREFADLQQPGHLGADELARAQWSLTRGYVRHFETGVQLARAAVHLVTHGLTTDVYDRFVPEIEAVTADAVTAVAREILKPDAPVIVVVGDADRCRAPLEQLGWPVVLASPTF